MKPNNRHVKMVRTYESIRLTTGLNRSG